MCHTAGVHSVEHSIVACCAEYWAEHNDRVRADGFRAGQEHALEHMKCLSESDPQGFSASHHFLICDALARLLAGGTLEE